MNCQYEETMLKTLLHNMRTLHSAWRRRMVIRLLSALDKHCLKNNTKDPRPARSGRAIKDSNLPIGVERYCMLKDMFRSPCSSDEIGRTLVVTRDLIVKSGPQRAVFTTTTRKKSAVLELVS